MDLLYFCRSVLRHDGRVRCSMPVTEVVDAERLAKRLRRLGCEVEVRVLVRKKSKPPRPARRRCGPVILLLTPSLFANERTT